MCTAGNLETCSCHRTVVNGSHWYEICSFLWSRV